MAVFVIVTGSIEAAAAAAAGGGAVHAGVWKMQYYFRQTSRGELMQMMTDDVWMLLKTTRVSMENDVHTRGVKLDEGILTHKDSVGVRRCERQAGW